MPKYTFNIHFKSGEVRNFWVEFEGTFNKFLNTISVASNTIIGGFMLRTDSVEFIEEVPEGNGEMVDLLLKLSFILNVAHQEHDFDMIGAVADMQQALSKYPYDKVVIKNINNYFGQNWTIAAMNKEYGFKY